MTDFLANLYSCLRQNKPHVLRLSTKRWRRTARRVFSFAIRPAILISWQVLVTLFCLGYVIQRDTQDTADESELTLNSDDYWQDIPLNDVSKKPERSRSRSRKLRAYTSRYFQAISKNYQQPRFSCSSVFAGDKKAVKRARGISEILSWLEEIKHGESARAAKVKDKHTMLFGPSKRILREVVSWPVWEFERLTNQWFLKNTKHCETFRRSRGYIMSPLTVEEENFPIAFSILVYKDVEMVERLLRMIYRPQNSYCIHVDKNSDPEFYSAVEAIANCFPDNVRMPSYRVPVEWGTYSTVEPELVCMRTLWEMNEEIQDSTTTTRTTTTATAVAAGDNGKSFHHDVKVKATAKTGRKSKWKYLINLTGQEFPLKTNYELVKILKAFNGANNEEGTLDRAEHVRWLWASKPPHGIKPIKGSVHTIINRATVDFTLHDQRSLDFLEWLRGTEFPDETLFASINYNPHLGIPGTYNGKKMENVTSFARFKKWNWKPDYKGCHSNLIVRGVCILSSADLRSMPQSRHLFANKFYLQQDRVVIGCLEELLFNNTRDEFFGNKTFDASFYAGQDFVLNQVRVEKA